MKTCNVCRHEKPISCFGRDRTRPDGRLYRCRDCQRLMVRHGVIRDNYKTGPKPMTLAERFWPKVIERTGCWGWNGARQRFGYGKIGNKHAHRISWEIHFGSIPKGMSVLHKCDTPECTNPDHLFLGTQRENMHDMLKKNRGRWRNKKQKDL